MGRKRAKEAVQHRGGQAYAEALEMLWSKKKAADDEKERKKEERYVQAYALQQEHVALKKEELELKRMLEEERIMTVDITHMSNEQHEYYRILQYDIMTRRNKM
ncbi:hypothetical protein GUJ93_ZPchr0015g6873 [Zizania palustris]|uniref:No apical meristem-associated C-terminal domain-containing protein n=1 Tax=Zizania palustris TaxID=103762 RepID=A0A8J5SYW5_ZIZPA|nr:hypothetical protein GUJ93_ZPchr0015g6873 [Zizania palustris]